MSRICQTREHVTRVTRAHVANRASEQQNGVKVERHPQSGGNIKTPPAVDGVSSPDDASVKHPRSSAADFTTASVCVCVSNGLNTDSRL